MSFEVSRKVSFAYRKRKTFLAAQVCESKCQENVKKKSLKNHHFKILR